MNQITYLCRCQTLNVLEKQKKEWQGEGFIVRDEVSRWSLGIKSGPSMVTRLGKISPLKQLLTLGMFF
jgi:hypothetical protein